MIKPHQDYCGAIRVYKKVFLNYQNIINQFNEASNNSKIWKWKNSHGAIYSQDSVRTSNEIALPTYGVDYSKLNPNDDEIRMIILTANMQERVMQHVADYANQFGLYIKNNEKTRLVRYEVGEYFKSHRDDHPLTPRTLSTVVYINDDYDGGELYFKYFDFKYKPEFGDLVIFPSNYAYHHESTPITSGTKYILTDFWTEGVDNVKK